MHLHNPAVEDPYPIANSASWVGYGSACSWAEFNRCAVNVGFTVRSAEIGPVSRGSTCFAFARGGPFPGPA